MKSVFIWVHVKRNGFILFGYFFKVEGRGQDLRTYMFTESSSRNSDCFSLASHVIIPDDEMQETQSQNICFQDELEFI